MININGYQLNTFQEFCFKMMLKRELDRQEELPEFARDNEYQEIFEMMGEVK